LKVLALVTDGFGAMGGIAQYNRDFLTALADVPECRILVLPRTGERDASLPARVRQLRARRGKLAYSLAALSAAIAHGPFDAVFCGHLYTAPLAAVVARVAGAPLWLQLHGSEAWQRPTRFQRWAAERARLVTAVSRYTRRRFLGRVRLDPTRVRVLPNTVAPVFAPGPKPAALVERYKVARSKLLLTVGRLEPGDREKGYERVMAALAALAPAHPDLVYLIAGEGSDRPYLERAADALGVAGRVRFSGLVAARELPDHYRLADVFVMPCTLEGFGIVFLEAAASGLRPIGGNVDGACDALADGALGRLVDPRDPEALQRAIVAALGDARSDGAAARRFAPENFARHAQALARALGDGALGGSAEAFDP